MLWTLHDPVLFQVKIVICFALWPTRIDGDRMIWLRLYKKKLRWEDGGYYEPDDNGKCGELLRWDFNKYGPRCWGTNACGACWSVKNTILFSEQMPTSKLDNYKRSI